MFFWQRVFDTKVLRVFGQRVFDTKVLRVFWQRVFDTGSTCFLAESI